MARLRYSEIDVMRGIAISLVLLGHSIVIYPINLREVWWCEDLHNYIYSFHMHAFFMLSGILYGFGRYESYRSYVIRKVRRLIVPYLIGNVVTYSLKIMFISVVNRKPNDIYEIIYNILFYGGNLWFLYVLFIISAIFPLVLKLRNCLGPHSGAIMAFLICLITLTLPEIEFMRITLVFYYLFFFYLGYLASFVYEGLSLQLLKPRILLPSFLIFILFGWVDLSLYPKLVRLLLPLAGSACLFYISKTFSSLTQAFQGIGQHSLEIYMLGAVVLGISRYIVINALDITNPAFIVILIFCSKLVVCSFVALTVIPRFAITRTAFGLS